MAFTKTQLMKQINAAATLGIITPDDLAGVFNDAPTTAPQTKKASPSLTPGGRRRWKHGDGGRSVPKNMRQAARTATADNDIGPARRFSVVHTKRDDMPHRLVLVDAETNRQVGRGIGEIVNTPAQVKAAAKRILKRAAKVDAN